MGTAYTFNLNENCRDCNVSADVHEQKCKSGHFLPSFVMSHVVTESITMRWSCEDGPLLVTVNCRHDKNSLHATHVDIVVSSTFFTCPANGAVSTICSSGDVSLRLLAASLTVQAATSGLNSLQLIYATVGSTSIAGDTTEQCGVGPMTVCFEPR